MAITKETGLLTTASIAFLMLGMAAPAQSTPAAPASQPAAASKTKQTTQKKWLPSNFKLEVGKADTGTGNGTGSGSPGEPQNNLPSANSANTRATAPIGEHPQPAAPVRGVPLKGIGVSLGKIPGGGGGPKRTDANGQADFGVLPVLPQGYEYTVTIDTVTEDAQVTILGAEGGPIVRGIDRAHRAAAQIKLSSDGKTPLVVLIEGASGSAAGSHSFTLNSPQ